jgi:nucleotide-binding universal stress UspA family protein
MTKEGDMAGLRHILAPVDLSPRSRHSVAQALAIAGPAGARLTLLYVAPPLVDDDTREELLMCLSSLAGIRSATSNVHLAIAEGDPDHEILAFAEEQDVELIVIGARRRGPLARALVESTGDTVLREARCSVLAVAEPGGHDAPGGRRLPARILCAVDLSDGSPDTLAAAAELARGAGAHLTVLHVIDPWRWGEPGYVSTRGLDQARDALERTASERLARLVADDSAGLHVETLVLFGIPPSVVPHTARALGATLVVVGSPARHRLGHTFLGSTAKGVLRADSCPVLLARRRVAAAAPAAPPAAMMAKG